jgi:hypothetical protein
MTITSGIGMTWKMAIPMLKRTVSFIDKSSALMSAKSARAAENGCVYNHSMHIAIHVQMQERRVTTLADKPKLVFPAGTPLDDVLGVIEAFAKGSVGNDERIVELIRAVSDGADKSDKILLEGMDKLAGIVQGLLTTVKNLQQRVAMLEGKETKH